MKTYHKILLLPLPSFLLCNSLFASTENDSIKQPFVQKVTWKYSVLSPLFGHTTVGFESEFRPGRSFESRLSLNGLGLTGYGWAGLGCNVGLKFKPKDRPAGKGGRFFRTEFGMNAIPYSTIVGGTIDPVADTIIGGIPESGSNCYLTLMEVVGSEWHISKHWMVEVFAGVGYEYAFKRFKRGDTKSWSRNVEGGYRFTHIAFGKRFPLAFTTGVMLGFKF